MQDNTRVGGFPFSDADIAGAAEFHLSPTELPALAHAFDLMLLDDSGEKARKYAARNLLNDVVFDIAETGFLNNGVPQTYAEARACMDRSKTVVTVGKKIVKCVAVLNSGGTIVATCEHTKSPKVSIAFVWSVRGFLSRESTVALEAFSGDASNSDGFARRFTRPWTRSSTSVVMARRIHHLIGELISLLDPQ